MEGRLLEIYKKISESATTIQPKALAREHNVSTRTIRDDIGKLNMILERHGAIIELQRSKGYKINIEDTGKYEKYCETMHEKTVDFRHQNHHYYYLAYELLLKGESVKIDDVVERFYVSRSVVNRDLKRFKETLEAYDLSLISKKGVGLYIEGDKKNRRSCFTKFFSIQHDMRHYEYYVNLFEGEFSEETLEAFVKRVEEVLYVHHTKMTDEAFKNFIFHVLIAIYSCLNGVNLTLSYNENPAETYVYIVDDIVEAIKSSFDLILPQSEQQYLYVQLMSKRVWEVDPNNYEALEEFGYIEEIFALLNERYGYDLHEDTQLKTDLLAHVCSMMYRLKNRIMVKNDMKDYIRTNYPVAYEITLDVMNRARVGQEYNLSENELAYLTLHIGAGIERYLYHKHQNKKTTIIIVCGTGRATARLLEMKILNSIEKVDVLRTMSIQEYNRLTSVPSDIVVSTVSIEEKNKPIISISLKPTSQELSMLNNKVKLRYKVNKNEIYQVDEQLFMKIKGGTKEEVLRQMTDKLEDANIVPKEYYQSVLKREELGSTVIGDIAAIPHPQDFIAYETKMCVCISDQPIIWNEKEKVRVIFLLAFGTDDGKIFGPIYDFILECLQKEKIDKMLQIEKFDDFSTFIQSILQEKGEH